MQFPNRASKDVGWADRSPRLSLAGSETDYENIFSQAVSMRASDIHLEPRADRLGVRFRIDGRLMNVAHIENRFADSLIARIKVAGRLDIAEKRRPQDGRILLELGTRTIDLRLSVFPTKHGEKIVARVLDGAAVNHDINEIGFSAAQLGQIKRALTRRRGILLVTGPTGSGKTTTLYSALNFLASEFLNICTLEDPIEYELPGINQSRIRTDIGYTFASSLRSVLRQDPDVIMIGEIRDKETAEIALRASLTGHLVLSTLHTNDAASTIIRLLEMGMKPYLIGSALSLVVAQRLVRRVCTDCRNQSSTVRCRSCHGSGFRGRVAVFETISVNNELAQLITHGSNRRRTTRLSV